MKQRLILPILILLVGHLVSTANAGLRDRIKERIVEREMTAPALVAPTSPPKLDQPGDYEFSLVVGDKTRFYRIHIPKKYSTKTPAPLLVSLHGGGGDMWLQSTENIYHQISKSESEGFIALFPNAWSPFPSGKLAVWNAGRCCGTARDIQHEDIAFIRELVKKTQTQLSIDPSRIFATGMSNGGMMAYRIACELPEIFRAIAAVAGTDNTISCKPAKSISILHIHAKDDTHVLFEGGYGKNAFPDVSKVTDFTSVPATIEKWKTLNVCEAKPTRVLDKKNAYCDLYKNCKDKTQLQLCVTMDGGHSWPGSNKPSPLQKGKPSTAILANDVMWNFFNSL